jgi:hypothetical protein
MPGALTSLLTVAAAGGNDDEIVEAAELKATPSTLHEALSEEIASFASSSSSTSDCSWPGA